MRKLIYINSVEKDEVSGQGSFERNFLSFLEEDETIVKVFTINNSKNNILKNKVSLKLNKSSKLSYVIYQINLFYYLLKEFKNTSNRDVYIRLAPFNIALYILSKFYKLNITARSGPIYQNLVLYNKVRNPFLLKVFKLLLKFYYQNTNNIIVVTNKIKELLIHDFNIKPNKITVISNPINNSLFEKEIDSLNIKKSIHINENDKIIGFVGDVYKEQGVQHIFTSLLKVKESININTVKVVIVGSGTYLEECKKLVSKLNLTNNVIFLGRVSPKEVIDYISIFDICLAPFTKIDYEAKGSSALKILEYLYCNKLVITIDVDEYKFIEEKGFGWLYKIDDLDDLSNKISIGLKSSLKIDAKDYVLNHFSKEKVFSKYLKIINNS